MQSLPVVSLSVDTTLPLSETNLDLGRVIFSLSEPAPVGGLAVNFDSVDGDGIPGDVDVSIVNGTLLFNEDNSFSGFLIDEGATEARFDIAARQDDISEGEETTTITLLPGEDYTIDSDRNIATYIVTDLPIVTLSVDRTVISEGEETPQVFTLQLNEPASDDGLTVRLQLEDPDGDFSDGGFPQELFQNISNLDSVVENGNFILEFTISPGATEATFSFLTGEDNRVEGDETYTLTLLDDESYSIDSASQPIVSTIIEQELPIVTFSVDRTVVSEGGEPQLYTLNLNEPAPSGGLTIQLQIDDPDGDVLDLVAVPEFLTNISNPELTGVDGNAIFQFKIVEGATEATFGLVAPEDDRVEGDETLSFTLLDGEDYSIEPDSVPIFTTITEKEIINGTSSREQLFGTDASEFIIGKMGNDTIFGNGGEDNLIGNEDDDLIFGGSQADTILTGDGNDTIFANGGGDFINSGSGDDTVWLGAGEATVILETGEGFDIVNNFQLGATTFQVESKENLAFVDSKNGANIFQGDDLLAVVSWQSANTFSHNQDSIFIV